MKKCMIYMCGLLLVLLGGLPACTKEIGGEDSEIVTPPDIDENTELEAVTIRIGAAETAETKAMHGDENAVEGEFIHSLHLFIVGHDETKGDTIAKHITVTPASEDLTAEQQAEAEIGNLPQYSTTIDIMPGTYTFYAFANMEYAMISENENMETKLSDLIEGGTWTDLSSVVINNPAANVDIANKKYIPMSVMLADVPLTTDGQRISLSLVRLVAKVRATLHNDRGSDISVTKLEMVGSYASAVPLFPSEQHEVVTQDQVIYTKDFTDSPIQVSSNNAHTFDDIYINETFDGSFALNLTIDRNVYEGILKATNISRNHILPVALTLSNTNLVLEIKAQVAPIGGYPVTVYTGDASLTNEFKIELPEGCTFTINGAFTPEVGTSEPVTVWQWTVPATSTSFVHLENSTEKEDGTWVLDNDNIPLLGYLTALPGQQNILLNYLVSMPTRMDGTLTIETVPLNDWDEYQLSTRSLIQWGEAPRWYEAVGLVKRPSAPGFNPEP